LGGFAGWRNRNRVREGSRKKLGAAFRYELRQKATDEFLLQLAEEESDAPKVSEDAPAWPEWSNYIRRAWEVLAHDRFIGSMGGIGRIFYPSISQYARDNGIPIEPFITFIHALDDEYVSYANDKLQEHSTQDQS
jgi:hypothetical protein